MKIRCLLFVVFASLICISQLQAELIFDRGATWKWRTGATEASSTIDAWRELGFPDTEFTEAPSPFWYGDPFVGGTQISGMSGNYTCLFFRKSFNIADASQVAGLRFGAIVDDGLVVWINGIEVHRINMSGGAGTAVDISTLAVNAVEPVQFTTYTLPDPSTYLVTGDNIIAIQVFQSSLGSSDVSMDASLDAILVETIPPIIQSVSPAGGSTLNDLTQIEVTFSESVTGVDAVDLLINDSPALSVTPIGNTTYRFTFPQPDYGLVQITWEVPHGIADEALPPNPFDETGPGATWQYTLVDTTPPRVASLTPAAGSTVRALSQISVLFTESVTGVDASDLLINGNPADSVTENAPSVYTFNFTEPQIGQVQVAWAPITGIVDQSPAANAFDGGNWTYNLDPTAVTSLLFISEFMAANTSGLMDEDGETSDWIEIHNAGAVTIDLDNYYLTDSQGDLSKWRFPMTNLAGGDFLVVFASGKNRRTVGEPLHTNFRLSSGGEYLALVRGDGGDIVSEFNPTYPPQAADVSYGFGLLTTNQTILTSNAAVRVQIPPNGSESLAWTLADYDDSGWISGTNGVGFGDPNATSADYSATVLPTEPVGYWRFNETSGSTAVNAGSGAGLNGTYSGATVGTVGPRPPQFSGFEADNRAPTFNGSSGYVGVNSSLLSGRNAFTLSGWVRTTASQANRTGLFGQNDCVEFGFIDASTLQCWTPGGGSVDAPYSLGIGNWFHVVAVGNGSTIRIFINGVQAASGGTSTANYGSSGSRFNIGGNGVFDATGNFFNGQIDEVVAYHRALSTTEIQSLYQAGLQPAVVSVTPYVQTDIGASMSNINASAYLRIPFTIEDPANVALLSLKMRYDDGFVAFINGSEVARANAPDPIAYNSSATDENSPASVEEFRFGPALLEPGDNVLAIQGLNRTTGNEDFLVLAEMDVTYIAASSSAPLYFTPATPGGENVGGVLYPGPAIQNAIHTPHVPLKTEALQITAQVMPTFNAVSSVVLRYRAMFNPEIQLTMFDDGAHNDGIAGDGVYGATIPANIATEGQMIRWFVSAVDVLGNQSRWPLFTAPDDSEEYLGTMVHDPSIESKLAVVHLFVQNTAASETRGGTRCSLYYLNEFYDNVDIHLRGQSSAGWPKKGVNLDFNRDHRLLYKEGVPRMKDIKLISNYGDKARMRSTLAYEMMAAGGSVAHLSFPVRAQRNGQFHGIFDWMEDADDVWLERLGLNPNGALYKIYNNLGGASGEKKTRKDEGTADLAELISNLNETQPIATRVAYAYDNLDLPQTISYFATRAFVSDQDHGHKNYYVYRDTGETDEWTIFPWDVDLAFGRNWTQSGGYFTDIMYNENVLSFYPGSGIQSKGSNRLYNVVFHHPDFANMYMRRLRTLMDTMLMPPDTPPEQLVIEPRIQEWMDQMDPPEFATSDADLDQTRWGPTWGVNYSMRDDAQRIIDLHLPARRDYLYATPPPTVDGTPIPPAQPPDATLQIGQIEFNPSSANQEQEFIELVNNNDYFVDISGWKIEGAVRHTFSPGTVVPASRSIYVSPNVAQFRARTTGPRGGQSLFVQGNYRGQLSARGETIRLVDDTGRLVSTVAYPGNPSLAQQYLRVTEIMYNPGTTEQNFEFIKLKNIGSVPLSLAGIRFTEGIYFDFTGSAVTTLAPGEIVLIVNDQTAFQFRYGTGLNVAGVYTGFLENGGERIRLLDATNEEILDFRYNNSWYPITDGLGFSLVVVDEQAEPDLWSSKSNWRSSGYLYGSPDASIPEFPELAPIVVNEVLTHTDPPVVDAVELFNPTTANVNLEGWFISDDFFTPMKYRIPNGIIIPAGGFVVFDESDFNPTPTVPPSFAFGSDGDEVYLFSGNPSTPELSGYVHGFDFGPAANGVSFGRHVISTGADHFVAQSALTLSNANAGPLVGPIVISEIMYHPPDELVAGVLQDNDWDEYIELYNISSNPVLLYDTNFQTNGWRLKDAVKFTFPDTASLPPNGYLLVVGFDPSISADLDDFRTSNNVDPSIPVYGPWDGKLDNSSDSVELARPDAPDIFGNVPYILVERVKYTDEPPWPGAADGIGPAMNRVDVNAYGNEPQNWVAAVPTPGNAFAGGDVPVITSQPQDQNVMELDTATFSVGVDGTGPFEYRWRFNDVTIAGVNSAELIIPSVQLTNQGVYAVVVLGSAGAVLSSNATLIVERVPQILTHPEDVIVNPGEPASFSVVANGTGPLTYQWRRNGEDLEEEATSSTYVVDSAQFGVDDGAYTVVVTDSVGSRESNPGHLIVKVRPVVTQHPTPASQTVLEGRTAIISVSASGTLPIDYYWRLNGSTEFIFSLDSHTSQLVLTNVKPALHAGSWKVGTRNIAGTGNPPLSQESILTVVPAAPFFAINPTDQSVLAGEPVELVSEARGTDVITYQWYFNDSEINGATDATLVLNDVQSIDAGDYHVVAENSLGSATSAVAQVSLVMGPEIVTQPVNQAVTPCDNAVFTVSATGTPPLSYQWFFNTTTLLPGQIGSSLTIAEPRPDDEGPYHVVVTDSGGSVTSTVATLTLNLGDCDGDGMSDLWEIEHGLNPNNPADRDLDPDNDGQTNWEESRAGTDPNDGSSVLKVRLVDNGNGGAMIEFTAMPEVDYTIEWTGQLGSGNWQGLTNISPVAIMQLYQVLDLDAGSQGGRFYRVVTPSQVE